MDWVKKEIIRIDEPATGGKEDPLIGKTNVAGIIDHCRTAEYVPELLPEESERISKSSTLFNQMAQASLSLIIV